MNRDAFIAIQPLFVLLMLGLKGCAVQTLGVSQADVFPSVVRPAYCDMGILRATSDMNCHDELTRQKGGWL